MISQHQQYIYGPAIIIIFLKLSIYSASVYIHELLVDIAVSDGCTSKQFIFNINDYFVKIYIYSWLWHQIWFQLSMIKNFKQPHFTFVERGNNLWVSMLQILTCMESTATISLVAQEHETAVGKRRLALLILVKQPWQLKLTLHVHVQCT